MPRWHWSARSPDCRWQARSKSLSKKLQCTLGFFYALFQGKAPQRGGSQWDYPFKACRTAAAAQNLMCIGLLRPVPAGGIGIWGAQNPAPGGTKLGEAIQEIRPVIGMPPAGRQRHRDSSVSSRYSLLRDPRGPTAKYAPAGHAASPVGHKSHSRRMMGRSAQIVNACATHSARFRLWRKYPIACRATSSLSFPNRSGVYAVSFIHSLFFLCRRYSFISLCHP